jgi:hypothetical protein
MSEAAARLAAAINKSWLDLENFMRIFRQQGHPRAPQNIWFLIKSIFDQVKFRSNRGASNKTAVPGFGQY